MILSTVLYILNIVIILSLAFYLVFLISDRKYGLTRSLIACLFRNYKGVNWYKDNPIYFVRILYVTVLLLINITLIGQLMNSVLFNRTMWLLTLSPCVWLCVFLDTWLREHKRFVKH